ncbi:hypothetical protein PRZ48_008992 [Zasmidium cellare]|uniref:Uncharacterized protein n=1 Tax=Zasmidium cellare TaxID=395010 RepID=A0ABR0EHQ2_ZASCE|nr:hypothetical protein PRZ48_008992 [Zasmidium cellare]
MPNRRGTGVRLSFVALMSTVIWSLFKFANPERDAKGKKAAAEGAAYEKKRQERKEREEIRRKREERFVREMSRRRGHGRVLVSQTQVQGVDSQFFQFSWLGWVETVKPGYSPSTIDFGENTALQLDGLATLLSRLESQEGETSKHMPCLKIRAF